jgi:hypothetical protein
VGVRFLQPGRCEPHKERVPYLSPFAPRLQAVENLLDQVGLRPRRKPALTHKKVPRSAVKNNAIRDLLGVTWEAPASFPADDA